MPGHSGVEGNEQVDLYAKAAAETGAWERADKENETISLAMLKARRTSKATKEWIRDIEVRNRGKSVFGNTAAGSRPWIRKALGRVEEYCGEILSADTR